MPEPIWVTTEQVVKLNAVEVEVTGEPFGIRDENALGSAVAAPKNSWSYGGVVDLVELGFILAMAIARNHPFLQGNKRAAWYAMLLFLNENGLALVNDNHEFYAEMFVDVIAGSTPPENLLALLTVIEIY